MRKYLWLASAILVAALFLVEAACFAGTSSAWRPAAGLTWLAVTVAVIVSAAAAALQPFFRRDFWSLPHRSWYLVAFLGAPALVLFGAGGIRFCSVDTEGLQQLAEGVRLLRGDPAHGVFSMAYSRYLARQYLVNGLPTYFLGPSLWAARFGAAMFYLAAFAFFLSALMDHLRRRRSADPLLLAGYAGALIAFGQYALLNARKFEQTSMPLGCVLFFLGAILHFLDRPGPLSLLWVTWSVGFFTGAYTPALAGWLLALVVLVYLVLWRQRWLLLPAIFYGLACLGVAFVVMQRADAAALPMEFAVGPEHQIGTAGWVHRCLAGLRATLGSDASLIPAPAALALAAAGVLAWRARDWRYAALLAWALAVALFSVLLIGSAFAVPSRALQRALVTVPPLVLGAVLLIDRHLSPAPDSGVAGLPALVLKASVVYMAFTGLCTVILVRSFFGFPMENDQDEVYQLASQLVTTPGAKPREFYMVPPLNVDLLIGMPYFAPDAKCWFTAPPAGPRPPGRYVYSYLKPDPADRDEIEAQPTLHPRPFVTLQPR